MNIFNFALKNFTPLPSYTTLAPRHGPADNLCNSYFHYIESSLQLSAFQSVVPCGATSSTWFSEVHTVCALTY